MPEQGNKKRFKIHEAILAILIPLYGYLLAYLFEWGFCTRFGIPTYFIEITLTNVLYILVLLILMLLIFYLYFGDFISSKFFESPPSGEKFFLANLIIFFVVFVICIFSVLFLHVYWLLYVCLMTFYFLSANVAFNFLIERDRESLKKRSDFKKTVELLKEIEGKGFQSLRILFSKDIIIYRYFLYRLTIIFVIISLLLFFPIGYIYAYVQSSFSIIKTNPELVILKKYSMNFICAPFDRKRREFRKRFYLKTSDQIAEKGYEIITEEIGPLKVSKVKFISPQDLQKILNIITTAMPPLILLSPK